MSFRRNMLASYASQIYVTAVGILIMPLYLSYMGPEAYGLVGFFTMLLTWFYLFDLGLTPTMSREMSRFRGGATDALTYRRLVRALHVVFLAITVAGGGALFALAGVITRDWLNVQGLPLTEVTVAVQMIAAGVALRWMSGLYRGAVSGAELLVWLGTYNAVIATARFVGVIPVLVFAGATPAVFFGYQLLVAALEVVGLMVKTRTLLPPVPAGERLGWSFDPVRRVLKFSLTIAFTSSVWVLVTQADKLVLSTLLPLAEYGYFMLAVLVASAVALTTLPIFSALMPRLAQLEARGEDARLTQIYRDATQLVCVVGLPVAFTLAAFAEPVLSAWSGDDVAARHAALILQLYAIGNGINAVASFPYYLQYAKGDMRLHLIGNVIFLVLLIPALVWATVTFGSAGAGWAWLSANGAYLVIWTPLVHRRFYPGLHRVWLTHDLAPAALTAAAASFVLMALLPRPESRAAGLAVVLVAGAVTLAVTAVASRTCRSFAIAIIKSGLRGSPVPP